MAPEPNDGLTLFLAFLDRNNLTQAAAARALGVSKVAVTAWVKRRFVPSELMQIKIAKWTHNDVPADSWPRVRPEHDVEAFEPPDDDDADEKTPDSGNKPKKPAAESKAAS